MIDKLEIGDRIKLNDTLCNNGSIIKINEGLKTCTIKWTYTNYLGKIHTRYQLHFIENILKFGEKL